MGFLSVMTLAVFASILQVSSPLPRPVEIAIHSDSTQPSRVYEVITRPVIHDSSSRQHLAEPAIRRNSERTAQEYELVTSPGEIPTLRLVVPVNPEPPANPYMHLEPEKDPEEEPSEELEPPSAKKPKNEPPDEDLVEIDNMTSIHCGRICARKTRHQWNVREKTPKQFCQTQAMARLYWELGPFAKCILRHCSALLLEQFVQEYTDWRHNFCRDYENQPSARLMSVEDDYDLAIATKSIEDALENPRVVAIALWKSQRQDWVEGAEHVREITPNE